MTTPPSLVSWHTGQSHLKNSSGSKFSVRSRTNSTEGRSRCTNVNLPLREMTAFFPYMKRISSSESMKANVGVEAAERTDCTITPRNLRFENLRVGLLEHLPAVVVL